MARISVTPEQLVGQAARLSSVPGHLNGAGAALAGVAGAAHETVADGELDHAVSAWKTAISLYSSATAELAVALIAAAQAYAQADRLPGCQGG